MKTARQRRLSRQRRLGMVSLFCSFTSMGLFLGAGYAHDVKAGAVVILSLWLGVCVGGVLALGTIIAATET